MRKRVIVSPSTVAVGHVMGEKAGWWVGIAYPRSNWGENRGNEHKTMSLQDNVIVLMKGLMIYTSHSVK